MSPLEKAVCQLRMKSCSLILLCLCITISAGHKAHHVSTSKGLPLLKRQTQDQCADIFAREICTKGYYEDYAFLAAQCFQRATAQNIQDVCGVNAMGRVCAAIDTPDPDTIESECGTSPTTCSSGCASALNNISTQLGCCVNAYNATDSESNDKFVYSYSLWSLCDVEPVTEQCTPSFDLPTANDVTCNPLSFQEQLYSRVICRAEFFDSLRSSLTSGGCLDEASTASTGIVSSCSVHSGGQHCDLRDNLYDQMDSASTNCPNTDSCNETCINTLNSIVDMSGCCFISEFNSSFEEPRDFLSYEFWQRCGLTSPGFCEVQLDTSPTRVSGKPSSGTTTVSGKPSSGTTTVSAAAALFILAVVSTFN